MKWLSVFIIGVLLCSCTRHFFYSEWRAFEFTDLKTRISVLRVCPNNDCMVAVKNQTGILFEDSKDRYPWFAVGIISKDAYGVLVCDKTSDNLFLLWNKVTNDRLSKIEVERVIEATLKQMGRKNTTGMPMNQLICAHTPVESEELRKQMTKLANSSGIISLR